MEIYKNDRFWRNGLCACFLLSFSLNIFSQKAEKDYIQFYQKYISPVRYRSCGMYPSCSRYSLMCFQERGFVYGMLLTADRLMRCCNRPYTYPRITRNNSWYFLDYPPGHSGLIPRQVFPECRSSVLADSIGGFIHYLMGKGFYSEALLEINKRKFFHSIFPDEIYLQELQCYEALGENKRAIREYSSFPPEISNHLLIRLEMAKIHLKEKNFEEVQRICAGFQKSDSVFKIAQTYRGIAYLEVGNSEAASQFFKEGENAPRNLAIVDEYFHFKRKNPRLATFYSIIPGGGYLYCGGKRTALTSFLINGLMGYAVYTSIKAKNYGLASLLGILNISFYFGNIKGANLSAKRYNQYRENNIKKNLYFNNHLN